MASPLAERYFAGWVNSRGGGAFVLDETAERIFYRDTLQLANLDLNELEGSVRALSLALAEYGDELLSLLKR